MGQVLTRNLNKIIDINFYPVPEARKSNMRSVLGARGSDSVMPVQSLFPFILPCGFSSLSVSFSHSAPSSSYYRVLVRQAFLSGSVSPGRQIPSWPSPVQGLLVFPPPPERLSEGLFPMLKGPWCPPPCARSCPSFGHHRGIPLRSCVAGIAALPALFSHGACVSCMSSSQAPSHRHGSAGARRRLHPHAHAV